MKQTTFLPTLLLLIITCALEAQTFETFCHFPDDENPQLSQKTNVFSENGQTLPANGHIEILLIYAEIDYTSGQDPNPSGNQLWGAGQLPTWKDDLLDVTFQTNPQGALSRYFHDASSGNLKVTGDYLVAPSNNGLFKFSANASDDYNELINKLLTEVNLQMGGNFITGSGITNPTYFDNWIKTGQGLPKLAGPNTPTMKFDHVMIIIRNHAGLNGTGRGSYSGFPFSTITQNLMGYDAETYTLQGSFDKIPFKICRHEFSHMILGGNTFHCAGGGVGVNYWIPYTGGHSMLGLSEQALLCWNAWDRYRLGWNNPQNQNLISARDVNGNEVNGDLDPMIPSQAGIYVLRDFVTTGDALRKNYRFSILKDLSNGSGSKIIEDFLIMEMKMINFNTLQAQAASIRCNGVYLWPFR